MQYSDGDTFKKKLNGVLMTYGHDAASREVFGVWWSALKTFLYQDVEIAMDRHVQRGKFSPKPAEIIELLITSDGRPTADEAWAIAVQAEDEDNSVIWTDEISKAFLSIAMPILESGDKIGARIGFRDNYNRLVDQARSQGIKIHWFMTAGNNAQIRHDTAARAKELGLISGGSVDEYLLDDMTTAGSEIAGLIGTTQVNAITDSDNKTHIEEIREMLSRNNNNDLAQQEKAKREEKEKLESRRAELIKQSEDEDL